MAVTAPRLTPRLAAILCALLVALTSTLSYFAVVTKSATIDEPLVGSAYACRFLHDYRLDPEHPPLWKYWAALPHSRDSLRVDTASDAWRSVVDNTDRSADWCRRTLYQTPGNND